METSITPFVPQNLGQASELAETLSKSKLLPVDLRGNKSDVLVQIITGSELGLGPMQSIRSIHIIKGKPTMSADLMVALVKRSPECVSFKLVETDAQHAIYETERKNEGKTRLGFTMEEAKAAGLLKDDSGWKRYPAAMLRARAASALCRAVYPDLLLGVYETSEAEEIRGADHAERVERVINEEPVDAPSSFDCSPLLADIEKAKTPEELKALIPKLKGIPDDAKEVVRGPYNAKLDALNAALNAAEQAAEAANG